MIPSISGQTLITLILQYRYFALYPAVFLEGPLVTMLAGFLVSLNILDPIISLIIITAGDVSSDTFFYCLGWLSKIWHRTAWVAKRFQLAGKEKTFIRIFNRHGIKMVIIGKLTHALAGIVFMGAGYSRISPLRVLNYSVLGAFGKAMIFMYVGYLAGTAYERFYFYLEYGSLIISLLIIVSVFLFFHYSKKIIRSSTLSEY